MRRPQDLSQPGHIFPLTAQPGGVLTRAGHTEAGCDLAALAGLEPAAVLIEVLHEDGSMARRPELEVFARKHGLKIGTIADLIRYRLETEKTMQRVHEEAGRHRVRPVPPGRLPRRDPSRPALRPGARAGRRRRAGAVARARAQYLVRCAASEAGRPRTDRDRGAAPHRRRGSRRAAGAVRRGHPRGLLAGSIASPARRRPRKRSSRNGASSVWARRCWPTSACTSCA